MTIVVPDYFSEENCPVFLVKTSLLSPNGELEFRTAQIFSFFQKSSNNIGHWVKDIDETACPFFYIEAKGAIYASLEDALKGIPKNFISMS